MTCYDDIKAERVRQDTQWGGAEHDDAHSWADWARFRQQFETRMVALCSPYSNSQIRVSRERDAAERVLLVKIAALCVARAEAIDRGLAP